MLLAGTLRAEANLAVANGLFLVLLFLGGMAYPLSKLPDAVETFAKAAARRGAVGDGPGGAHPGQVVPGRRAGRAARVGGCRTARGRPLVPLGGMSGRKGLEPSFRTWCVTDRSYRHARRRQAQQPVHMEEDHEASDPRCATCSADLRQPRPRRWCIGDRRSHGQRHGDRRLAGPGHQQADGERSGSRWCATRSPATPSSTASRRRCSRPTASPSVAAPARSRQAWRRRSRARR